jgi:CheY-like chemotaxis protein
MEYMVQGSRNGAGAPPRKSQTILVVDDKLDTLLLVRELLTSRGYNVTTASDADEAIQAIQAERPDLILLDVIMPGRSGYDLCHELKNDPSTRLIPVVMITGLSDRSDRIRGIEAGADDFLSKPLYPEEPAIIAPGSLIMLERSDVICISTTKA